MSEMSVIPLESNPAIFNDLSEKLGLCSVLQFHDVYSLTDPDLVGLLPQPVYGIILLFPLTSNYESYRSQTDGGKHYDNELIDRVNWFKQTINNGCGLYALLHILGNLPSDLIMTNSLLSSVLANYKSSNSDQQIKLIEDLESTIKLDDNYGVKGQTQPPNPTDVVDLHFISFVKGKDNHLYELDGRRPGPIDLGLSVAEENILHDENLIKKIQFYIENTDDANKHNFAMMAVGPSLE